VKSVSNQLRKVVGVLLAAGLLVVSGSALADTLVTHSYQSAQTQPPGTLVSLSANPDVVEPSNLENTNGLLGVVVSNQGSYITDDPSAGTLVETGGVVPTLVSTLNGDIKVGDRITTSAVDGVGAKALSGARIVGIAQASFSASSAGATQTTVTDSFKAQHKISVGQILVDVGVSYYTPPPVAATNKSTSNTLVPPAVENFLQDLTGKSVSTVSLSISGLLLVAALILAGIILHAGISSTITSVGRNPLARTTITHNLIRVTVIAAAVLLAGMGLSYVVLLVA
jgi:hypothetical protein